MKDDDLIRGLAQALKDESGTADKHARWEALAKSELGADERAELEKLAAQDPDAAKALAMYQPLGAEFEAQVARSFLEARPRATGSASAKVVRLGAFIATPLAMAAAVALWIGRAGRAEELPTYEIALASNVQAERGGDVRAPSADARLHRNAYFEAVARPSVAPQTPIGARAVLVRNGHASRWDVPIAISKEGAVRIAGPADALFPETTGAYDIVLAVAPAASLPDERTLEQYAESSGAAPAFRVVRAHVTFLDE